MRHKSYCLGLICLYLLVMIPSVSAGQRIQPTDYWSLVRSASAAIAADPGQASLYKQRGNAYYCLGKYQEAMIDYNTAIVLDPVYADGYNNRGNIYNVFGEAEKAAADYTAAIEINPRHVKA